MSKLFLTAGFAFIFSISFSQDYVVTIKTDTVRGEVKLLSYDLVDRIQLSQGKKKTTYTAMQIRRASVKGEQFAPVKLENGIRMMKVIRTGILSLYAHRAQGQGNYDTRIIQKIGERAIEVPNIGFKKFVGELVADCPTVSDKVKMGDYDRNKVEPMVDEYNACMNDYNNKRIQESESTKTPVAELIEQMKTKVSASDISNKSDANDLLNSIGDRYKKKEAVPAYMKEGLKGYLSSNEALKADMEKLFTLIDQ